MTSEDLNPHHVEWLSLIKYQLAGARIVSKSPAPVSSVALNAMHDAAESLLMVSADKLGVDPGKNPDFMALVGTVVKSASEESLGAHKTALRGMNDARVNFKHKGNAAAQATVARHMDAVEAAALDIADVVFGVDLNAVSMNTLIADEEVRSHLEASAQHRSAGSHDDSMGELAFAFELLLDHHEATKTQHPLGGRSVFSTKPRGTYSIGTFGGLRDSGLEGIAEWLKSIDNRLRATAMGVNPAEHAFFSAHMPDLIRGRYQPGYVATWHGQPLTLDDDTYERCVRFVVDTALTLQSRDFVIDHSAAPSQFTRVDTRKTVMKRIVEASETATPRQV